MESDWYTVGTALALSAIGFYTYMALRKPRPISNEINFEVYNSFVNILINLYSQEESLARKSKIYQKSQLMTHFYEDALTLNQVIYRGSKESGILYIVFSNHL
jgi:hypothetical protein